MKDMSRSSENEIVLTVRDRRRVKQFTIDNMILDEWFPLIGETGFAIYSLFVRMSNPNHGESCSVSFSVMAEHLNMHNSTLSNYISFLELCGLIYRDRPEIILHDHEGRPVKRRQGNRANTYYVLDIQTISRERLNELKTAVSEHAFTHDYQSFFLGRIETWRPIQKLWASRRRQRIKTQVAQLALDLGEQPKSPPTANKQTHALLRRVGVIEAGSLKELGGHSPALVLALIWYAHVEHREWLKGDVSGWLKKQLRVGTVPPNGYLRLSEWWLGLDEDHREGFVENVFGWGAYMSEASQLEAAEAYELDEDVCKAAIAIGRKQLSEWIEF